jgi:hypothetical protein
MRVNSRINYLNNIMNIIVYLINWAEPLTYCSDFMIRLIKAMNIKVFI